MKFFKNPAVLLILSLLLIVSSTVFSTRVKLGGKCDDVTDIFYTDTAEQRSIATLLREIVTQSTSLSLIAQDYGIDTEDFDQQADWLEWALRSERGSERYIYVEYSELLKAFTALRRQLDSAALTQSDQAMVNAAENLIDADIAQITELSSVYNNAVRSFNRRYDRFPATFMASFSGVDMPEEFT